MVGRLCRESRTGMAGALLRSLEGGPPGGPSPAACGRDHTIPDPSTISRHGA